MFANQITPKGIEMTCATTRQECEHLCSPMANCNGYSFNAGLKLCKVYNNDISTVISAPGEILHWKVACGSGKLAKINLVCNISLFVMIQACKFNCDAIRVSILKHSTLKYLHTIFFCVREININWNMLTFLMDLYCITTGLNSS